MIIDEPTGFGGTDSGPGPAEILLVALGTCQEVVYCVHASLMGVELESVQCELRAHLELRLPGAADQAAVPNLSQEYSLLQRRRAQ
jgi:uncharacterized OsmC-like protein